MITIRKATLALMLTCTVGFSALANAAIDAFDDVAQHLRAGNVRSLAVMLDENVELALDEREGVMNRTQAEIVLRTFMQRNPPRSFIVKHRGSSADGARYAIGVYTSSTNQSYRTYVVIKPRGGSNVVQELRLERE